MHDNKCHSYILTNITEFISHIYLTKHNWTHISLTKQRTGYSTTIRICMILSVTVILTNITELISHIYLTKHNWTHIYLTKHNWTHIYLTKHNWTHIYLTKQRTGYSTTTILYSCLSYTGRHAPRWSWHGLSQFSFYRGVRLLFAETTVVVFVYEVQFIQLL